MCEYGQVDDSEDVGRGLARGNPYLVTIGCGTPALPAHVRAFPRVGQVAMDLNMVMVAAAAVAVVMHVDWQWWRRRRW